MLLVTFESNLTQVC